MFRGNKDGNFIKIPQKGRKVVQDLVKELFGKISPSLLEEFKFQCNSIRAGKAKKVVVAAVIRDVIAELESRKVIASSRIVNTKAGKALYLNEDAYSEIVSEPFTLFSEPTEPGFANNYHDLPDAEIFRAEDPLEQKGRLFKPIFLDDFTEFLLGEVIKCGSCDTAQFGNDKSVLTLQHGGHILDIQSFFKQDINETTGRAVAMIEEYRPDEFCIDVTGGWGAGVYNALIALDMESIVTLTPVSFATLPRDDKYLAANARAEMYLILQERFRLGTITLPKHRELIEELSWIKYRFQNDSKIFIEAKAECRKRNKRSPDHADSCAMSFYYQGNIEVY
jgi:hypothetical protein